MENEEKRKGKYRSRPHNKQEKRKQRKAWLKRKRERRQDELRPEVEPQRAGEEIAVSDLPRSKKSQERNTGSKHYASRGKAMVELSRKRKQQRTSALPRKTPKRHENARIATPDLERRKSSNPKEIDRALLTVDRSRKIGSGTFGTCYSALYRDEYRVVVKEIKSKDDSSNEMERALKEVLHEATTLQHLGDHPGIPFLFGVCTEQAPFYLVLQYHAVEGRSVTLSKAATTAMISSDSECVKLLRNTCETLMYIHSRGYLHNDLKGNNVVLDGQSDRPVIIDFGKSVLISKSRLRKPKLNVDQAIELYPHIAPEIHRGERQTRASDVYSFGAMVRRFLKDGKFDISALKKLAKKCLSSNPSKRPELDKVLQEISKI